MKILGLIPARGGSKGIPGKNHKPLAGKALIHYSIEVGLACPQIDHLMVSTDDPKIAEVSKAAGADVPFLRPAHLATDQSPTIDTVIHALTFMEEQERQYDAICLLQATSPFRSVANLVGAIEQFKRLDADSLVSVREVPHAYNPHWVFEVNPKNGFLQIATGEQQIIPRRQALPQAFHRDGAIYLTKRNIILEERSLYGAKMAHYLIDDQPNINIDQPEDWARAELEMAKRK
ncbi:MAG: acylneuraminate cytidylyltransferase family protein [Bacteroidota bacterium]